MFSMQFRYLSGNYQIGMLVLDNLTGNKGMPFFTLIAGSNYIEIDWNTGDGDGYLSLWINGQLQYTVNGLHNDGQQIDEVWLGPWGGIDANTRGTYHLDAFESRTTNYIGE